MTSEQHAINVMLDAAGCNDCFQMNIDLAHAECDTPQPRWIGMNYFQAIPRIALVLINPGGGGTNANSALAEEADLFRKFFDTGDYELIREYFLNSILCGDRWLAWYNVAFGLNPQDIAQLNIAWCATKGNRYPRKMLNFCFEKHTIKLLNALNPDIIILSGNSTHLFAEQIRSKLPNTKIIRTLHYAHRKSLKEANLIIDETNKELYG